MAKRNQELGFNLMNSDSANCDRIAGDSHNDDTTIPLPVISASPLPNWNMRDISQYYCQGPAVGNSEISPLPNWNMREISQYHCQGPAVGNSAIGSSQINSSQRPDSGFLWSQGHTEWPFQHTSHDNLKISDDVMNAAFNLNGFAKPESEGKCVIQSDGLVSRPQMANPGGMALSRVGHPLTNTNSGMAMFNPNQGGAEPFLSPGKFDDRFMTFGSGTNKESKSNIMVNFNQSGTTEMVLLPPNNASYNQQGSRSFLNSGLDVNGACSVFQNDSEIVSDLTNIGNQEVFFDAHARSTLPLEPSYAFQRLASRDQNNYLRQVNRDLNLGGVKDKNMEFADSSHKSGFERCMALPSQPFVGSQTMPSNSGRSRANGRFVPSSIGMVADKPISGILPKNNWTFSSQSFASPPSVKAARSTREQDPSSNQGQSQVVGSSQQPSWSPFGPYSASGTAQVSMPSMIASKKRAASQPQSSTVRDQLRRIEPTQPFIHPSIPNWTRSAPLVPNAPQSIPPLVHAAQSLSPISSHPLTQPLFLTRTESTLPAPNTTQPFPPTIHQALFPPSNDNRISSFHPSSHTSPLPNQQQIAQSLARQKIAQSQDRQQIAQSLARQQIAQARVRQLIAQSQDQQHSRALIIPSNPNLSPHYVKYKDKTEEPIGYKCLLCKRDLSFAPEGPISQPPIRPAAAVLSCGHTFHEYCLERITPRDQSNDPPCIPCALCE